MRYECDHGGRKAANYTASRRVEAAGLKPNDQVDWRFEDGEIRGRKLVPHPGRERMCGKLVKRGDALFLEIPEGFKLAPDAIARAVREERDSP